MAFTSVQWPPSLSSAVLQALSRRFSYWQATGRWPLCISCVFSSLIQSCSHWSNITGFRCSHTAVLSGFLKAQPGLGSPQITPPLLRTALFRLFLAPPHSVLQDRQNSPAANPCWSLLQAPSSPLSSRVLARLHSTPSPQSCLSHRVFLHRVGSNH